MQESGSLDSVVASCVCTCLRHTERELRVKRRNWTHLTVEGIAGMPDVAAARIADMACGEVKARNHA